MVAAGLVWDWVRAIHACMSASVWSCQRAVRMRFQSSWSGWVQGRVGMDGIVGGVWVLGVECGLPGGTIRLFGSCCRGLVVVGCVIARPSGAGSWHRLGSPVLGRGTPARGQGARAGLSGCCVTDAGEVSPATPLRNRGREREGGGEGGAPHPGPLPRGEREARSRAWALVLAGVRGRRGGVWEH